MPNRLVHESSPYLQQHANNPVDWYAWGEEALGRAKAEDQPILLSIGYSACHWCHVMEHESFEDPEIAGLMNESFVNIKVERYDAAELRGGGGGLRQRGVPECGGGHSSDKVPSEEPEKETSIGRTA